MVGLITPQSLKKNPSQNPNLSLSKCNVSLSGAYEMLPFLSRSVSHTNVVTADASSHWLQGMTLIIVYILM